eukprot:CAMPEP_0194170418 /NCGR_PEP_ID=MMETSP0154-20130528/5054_1 /TAXON_ID=1049557 /ORGANISM="Thalassiothrix antarctica, Strain L6-D1" /LENGTH=267 /DNA_ID=CAMNT_0038882243 /DNA_START=10 /DNA_END=813 /DNA_ORIENTATION=-
MTAIRANKVNSIAQNNMTIPAVNKRSLKDHSLNVAKANFMEAVKLRIDELMRCEGYSRDNATRTLIREIGCEVNLPTETEIFHLMEVNGLGVDDAVRVLIVSKAVQRSINELGFSTVEAIDDLTVKLNINNTFNKSSRCSISPQEEGEQGRIGQKRALHSHQPTATMTMKSVTHKIVPAIKIKSKLHVGSKAIAMNRTINSRKRPFPGEKSIGRARIGSAAEEINAKLKSTKQQQHSESSAGKSSIRGKRLHTEGMHQSSTKRPRET